MKKVRRVYHGEETTRLTAKEMKDVEEATRKIVSGERPLSDVFVSPPSVRKL